MTAAAAVPTHEFPDDLVARPRLVSRLVAASDVPLAVIAAPAGYGKTTLLADWARHDVRRFAWLRLDDSDNDHAGFLARIEEALDDIEPFVLVLDDLHTLHAPDCLQTLRNLIQQIPPGSQLAVASRTEPALPLGRLRAHRALIEIRAHDLSMTVAEAAELVARAGLKLRAGKLDRLIARTEGWPAGLYLAAVSARARPDDPMGAAQIHGDDDVVSEYLRDEVVSQLAPDDALFLTRASVLDRLSGPVCDAVLERRDSARLLCALSRETLLLVPLDHSGESYRCHSLLTEMLQRELRRLEPDAERDLHRRASDWYAWRGDTERAIDHAIAADDFDHAGELMWGSALDYVAHGRNAQMRRWLGCFTRDQIAAQPALALTAASSDLAMGELDAVQRWESAIRRTLAQIPIADRTTELQAQVSILRSAVAGDGIVRMGEDAARAYELEPEDSPWRSWCCLLEGVTRHLTGFPAEAERRLEEGVWRGAVAAPTVQTLCLAQLALLAADREDWHGGAALVARAGAQVEHYGLADYPTTALVFAASAAARARLGRVQEAQEDLRRGLRLLATLHDFVPWYEVETRVALARATLRTGDVAAARDLIADARRIMRRTPEAVVLQTWIEDAHAQADAVAASAADGLLSLTTAELRILGFLPTHLSFREIAGRLFVSANTVKTQAHSVYRKLAASSRSEAVARASELGLLDRSEPITQPAISAIPLTAR